MVTPSNRRTPCPSGAISHDSDDRSPPCTPAISSELAERRECVINLVDRNAKSGRTSRIADHECPRASLYGLCEEVVPVERRPLERDETTPLGELPCIRIDASDRRHTTGTGAERVGDPVECPEARLLECVRLRRRRIRHYRTAVETMDCTISRSSNGYFTVPRIW